jgi:hypothetical protein
VVDKQGASSDEDEAPGVSMSAYRSARTYRSTFDRRLNSHEREIAIRKMLRSEARVRGVGFGRRPLAEVAA